MSRTKPILLFSVVAIVAVMGAAALAAGTTARLEVSPRQTEVYVDGLRVGIADDFDGFTQRLRVDPGEHLIELYLDGHKPVSQTIVFLAGDTYRIRHQMEPLPPGESAAPVAPVAPVAPAKLSIRVQPGDAIILVDGEEWRRSSGDRLELAVAVGVHSIEVRKEGYQPFITELTVTAGETSTMNVSLTRG